MRLSQVWEPGTAEADRDEVDRPFLHARPEGGWDLLYSGRRGATWSVCRASTPETEPHRFAPAGVPLAPGPAGSGEDGAVRSPCVVQDEGEGLVVLYTGSPPPGRGRPGLFSAVAPRALHKGVRPRRSGTHGVSPPSAAFPAGRSAPPGAGDDAGWRRLGPVLAAGQDGDADGAGCDHPAFAQVGRRRWLWYTAHDGLGRGGRIAAASSEGDGPWTRHGVVLGRGAPGQPDEYGAEAPSVLIDRLGRLDLVYTGWGRAGPRVMRARSSDGLNMDRLGPVSAPEARGASLAVGADGRRWLVAVVRGAVAVGVLEH